LLRNPPFPGVSGACEYHHGSAGIASQVLSQIPCHDFVPYHLRLAKMYEGFTFHSMGFVSLLNEIHILFINITAYLRRQLPEFAWCERRESVPGHLLSNFRGNIQPYHRNTVFFCIKENTPVVLPWVAPVIHEGLHESLIFHLAGQPAVQLVLAACREHLKPDCGSHR